jgi:hypothetical protein
MYTGQLISGPDQGNVVTSKVPQILSYFVTIHNLEGNDSEPLIEMTKGTYVWQENRGAFVWRLFGTKMLTIKEYTEWVKNKYESSLNPDTQPQTGAHQTPDSPSD